MSEAFRSLAGGFRLVYAGLVLVVLAAVVNSVGQQVILQQGGVRPQIGGPLPEPLLVLTGVTGAVTLVGAVLGLVGRLRCTAVPAEVPGAKGKVTASVVLEAVALVANVGVNVDAAAVRALPPAAHVAGGGAAALCGLAAAVLFLLFTAAVAEYVRRPDLARSARRVLVLFAVLAVLIAVLIGALVAILASVGGLENVVAGGPPKEIKPQEAGPGLVAGGAVMCGAGCPALILMLVTLILYARLLIGMRAACLGFADTGSAAPAGDPDDRDREWGDDRDDPAADR